MARHDGDRDGIDRHSPSREKSSDRSNKGERSEEQLDGGKPKKKRDRDDGKERHDRRHERKRHKKRHRDNDRHRKRHKSSHSSGDRRQENDSDSEGPEKRRERKRDSKKSHKKSDKRERDSRKPKKRDKNKRHNEDRNKESKRAKVDKSRLFPLGQIKGSPPEAILDVDKDYFSYHQHLWIYLYREEGRIFGDLTSEEAHAAFGRFVRRYNQGKLEDAYYDPKGMPAEALEECKTTRHAWSFKTSSMEQQSLKFLQEGVRKQTEYDFSQKKQSNAATGPRSRNGDGAVNRSFAPKPRVLEERPRQTPEERLAQRAANKRLREHARTAEEEFSGGRKDGRERQIEKRKEKAATIHGSARDREEGAMGGVALNDDAIYGGIGSGETNFKDALAREKRRAKQRREEKNARVAELQKKDNEKQEAMLKMLGLSGLKPGQKITIAPRKDA